MGRRALSLLGYPLVTGGAVAFAVWALARHWPAWAIGIAVVAGAMAVVVAFERVIPYSAEWSKPRGDRRTDIWHFIVSNRGFDLGAFLAITVVPPIGLAIWPRDWPLAAQAILALILVEMPAYWIHRLEHRSRFLWRLHAVHHSSERLYWWNLARNHPLDNFVTAFSSLAALALLGVGEAPLAIVASFSGAHALLQHSNADLRTGMLDLVFSTPRVHRWHHSRVLDESNANYGQTIVVWDWVFGTRRFSAKAAPPEAVGLAEDGRDFPTTFGGHMRSPFDNAFWRRA